MILARAASREEAEESLGGEEGRVKTTPSVRHASGKERNRCWRKCRADHSCIGSKVTEIKDLPKKNLREQETHSSSSFL